MVVLARLRPHPPETAETAILQSVLRASATSRQRSYSQSTYAGYGCRHQ